MRRPIIAGNWKMHKTSAEARRLITDLKQLVGGAQVEVVVCPPFTALAAAVAAAAGSNISVGAQDIFWEDEGAYTGEISGPMLKELGCRYCIIGHSERRQYFGETNATVKKKVQAAFRSELTPIVCVGETLAEREAGQTLEVCRRQVEEGLGDLTPEQVARLVVAYEPVWAIGTGKNATGEDAQEAIGYIRERLAAMYGREAADKCRIQYGGSVKPENIAEFMARPDIDGALVGGASLDPISFAAIVNTAAED
ncbi:MAG: triose-phosphate isomerase [Thermoanaerobacteraceae bacterium]|uniref:triose-phosphate isomerase n=1 Tax=Thermanaeromonas sp. C210 TaxID=2731925 RepID=UPI00155C1010|nr:triose-phosphate isomerase [Thermanaeromonas sp. C210]MBE3581837.1 triose-phosphate isomerase [Thermoanaerobacteraceae bacterium]GFN22719.1 triosephosphate isomerase [Thermanaeromonas sp. C210]